MNARPTSPALPSHPAQPPHGWAPRPPQSNRPRILAFALTTLALALAGLLIVTACVINLITPDSVKDDVAGSVVTYRSASLDAQRSKDFALALRTVTTEATKIRKLHRDAPDDEKDFAEAAVMDAEAMTAQLTEQDWQATTKVPTGLADIKKLTDLIQASTDASRKLNSEADFLGVKVKGRSSYPNSNI